MERLDIDDLIKIVEGLQKDKENAAEYLERMEEPKCYINTRKMESERYKQISKYLKDLKEYQDLEEQGLLLRLPCKVGEVENNNIYEKIKKIADTYGYDAQSRQCIEEMAELTQAINKLWRKDLKCSFKISYLWDWSIPKGAETYRNLVEELADVQIMLWQMAYLLNADVTPIIEQKLDRQLERIESESRWRTYARK